MYACRFFPESKTAEHIEVAIDNILSEAGADVEQTHLVIQIKVQIYCLPQIVNAM